MKKWLSIFLVLMLAVLAGCARPSVRTGGAAQAAAEEMEIHCLDIGQGDAALIGWQNKWTMIDTGDVEHRPQIVKLLEQYGVKELENLIITHPDSDHLGGAYAILKKFPVRNVFDNGQEKLTHTYHTYLKTLDRKKLSPTVLRDGMNLDLGGGAYLQVLSPGKQLITKNRNGEPDFNNNSIVMKLVLGDFSMLFTGDAEKLQEKSILRSHSGDLKSVVLKVGHHGSYTSSSREFLHAIAPRVAIISCGRDNPYGVPHKVTMRNLEETRAKIYRTDRDGTVTVRTDGNGFWVEGEYSEKN